MTRRGLLAALAGATLDPERLLWVPRAKTISIPAPPKWFVVGYVHREPFDPNSYLVPRGPMRVMTLADQVILDRLRRDRHVDSLRVIASGHTYDQLRGALRAL